MTATADTPDVAGETGRSTIANPGRLEELVGEQKDREQEQVELHGAALDLFQDRFTDTFEVDRHGHEIEFYRPVDATKADPDSIREENPELADRLERGGRLLDEWRERQQAAMLAKQDTDVDAEAILEEFTEAGELLCGVLSAHAVDESFRDPQVWEAIFPNGDAIRDLFEDFFSEGAPSTSRRRRHRSRNG